MDSLLRLSCEHDRIRGDLMLERSLRLGALIIVLHSKCLGWVMSQTNLNQLAENLRHEQNMDYRKG